MSSSFALSSAAMIVTVVTWISQYCRPTVCIMPLWVLFTIGWGHSSCPHHLTSQLTSHPLFCSVICMLNITCPCLIHWCDIVDNRSLKSIIVQERNITLHNRCRCKARKCIWDLNFNDVYTCIYTKSSKDLFTEGSLQYCWVGPKQNLRSLLDQLTSDGKMSFPRVIINMYFYWIKESTRKGLSCRSSRDSPATWSIIITKAYFRLVSVSQWQYQLQGLHGMELDLTQHNGSCTKWPLFCGPCFQIILGK